MAFSFRRAVLSAALLACSLAVPLGASAQTTTRLSVGSGGTQGDDDSLGPKISADGKFAVYRSYASTLVTGDTNAQVDLFVTELATGTTKRVNVSTAGAQATGLLLGYSISGDGRYVAFSTLASTLVTGDTNGFYDIFLRDTVSNTTTRISTGTGGAQSNGSSIYPSISSNGRYIAYESLATNLVAGDTNAVRDVFVYDTTTATTTRLSVDSAGTQGNALSFGAVISGDGSAVAFYSEATNLVAGDTNAAGDVFVRNLTASTTTRVSVSTGGAQGDDFSGTEAIAISSDGKVIAFDSFATNLVAGDTNDFLDVFVRDITVPASPTTTRVSVSSAGVEGDGNSFLDTITPNGKVVLFDSDATNLVSGDTNDVFDIFLRDRTAGTTTRVSLGAGGVEGNDESSFGDLSSDGNVVVFASFATNLVAGDTNGFVDIFARSPLLQTASVTGTLTLQGISPTAPNQTFTFTFRNGGTDIVKTASVGPSGAFTITGLPRASYTLLIKGGSYLASKITVDASAGNVTLANSVLMRTGDVNGDNVDNITDLLLLIGAYNQVSPATGYLAAADLNLDNVNDISDLLLLIGNYNVVGDSL